MKYFTRRRITHIAIVDLIITIILLVRHNIQPVELDLTALVVMAAAVRIRTPIQAVLVGEAASNRVAIIRIGPPARQIKTALERVKLIEQANIGAAIARSAPIIDRQRQQLPNMARVGVVVVVVVVVVSAAVHSIPSSLRFEIVVVLNVMVMAAAACGAPIVMMSVMMAASMLMMLMMMMMMRLVRILDLFRLHRPRQTQTVATASARMQLHT